MHNRGVNNIARRENFKILGIETTCDETAAAVLSAKKIISDVVYCQIPLHRKFRGVVPELASRAHSEKIALVISKALSPIKKSKPIDAVCFAKGPGLPGALLVGKIAAETISKIYDVPLTGVNHLEGHFLACELTNDSVSHCLKFPCIALIVSGGHTELWLVKNYGRYRILGATRDDAAGEAFDKVAKLLGLGYPGGPVIEKYALRGNKNPVKFPKPVMPHSWDFSFSGIKTSVSYYLRDNKNKNIAEICAGFQSAIIDTLVYKTILAAKKYNVSNIVMAGGVSANDALRKEMSAVCRQNRFALFFPEKRYCSDNAAMIALAGYRKIRSGAKGNCNRINPQLKIKSWRKG